VSSFPMHLSQASSSFGHGTSRIALLPGSTRRVLRGAVPSPLVLSPVLPPAQVQAKSLWYSDELCVELSLLLRDGGGVLTN